MRNGGHFFTLSAESLAHVLHTACRQAWLGKNGASLAAAKRIFTCAFFCAACPRNSIFKLVELRLQEHLAPTDNHGWCWSSNALGEMEEKLGGTIGHAHAYCEAIMCVCFLGGSWLGTKNTNTSCCLSLAITFRNVSDFGTTFTMRFILSLSGQLCPLPPATPTPHLWWCYDDWTETLCTFFHDSLLESCLLICNCKFDGVRPPQ